MKAYYKASDVQGTSKTVSVVSFPPSDLGDVTHYIMSLHNLMFCKHLDMKLQHLLERERRSVIELVKNLLFYFLMYRVEPPLFAMM